MHTLDQQKTCDHRWCERFENRQLPSHQDGSHWLALKHYEEELLDVLKTKELDAILQQEGSVKIYEMVAPLRD